MNCLRFFPERGHLHSAREVEFVGVEKMAKHGIEKYISFDLIQTIETGLEFNKIIISYINETLESENHGWQKYKINTNEIILQFVYV